MYDGYKMGDKEIYNLCSILNYAEKSTVLIGSLRVLIQCLNKLSKSRLRLYKTYEKTYKE